MKRIGLLLLISLSLGLGACERNPGGAVDSPREQPAGSLEEIEEDTSDSDLVAPNIDGDGTGGFSGGDVDTSPNAPSSSEETGGSGAEGSGTGGTEPETGGSGESG